MNALHFKQLLVLLISITVNINDANCFSNLFNEVFDGIRYGTIDKNTVKEQFNLRQPQCASGSYFYNGSCYFISNHQSSILSSSGDSLISNLISNRNIIPDSLKSTYIGTQLVSNVLPSQANWRHAYTSCKQLNNESTLIAFDNKHEYEFLVNLLFKLKFNNNETDFIKEETFFIGLAYTNQTWTWSNDVPLGQSFMNNYSTSSNYAPELMLLRKNQVDFFYRQCAYISLRGNGDINIDNAICDKDTKPYICKYVLDRCFNNTMCGQNGECINLPLKKSFQCRCRILYEGKYCEKWSQQGIQMISGAALVLGALIVTIITKCSLSFYRKYFRTQKLQAEHADSSTTHHSQRISSMDHFRTDIWATFTGYMRKHFKFLIILATSLTLSCFLLLIVTYSRFKLIESRFESLKNLKMTLLKRNNSTTNVYNQTENRDLAMKLAKLVADSKWSTDICKLVQDTFIEDYIFVLLSLPLTFFIYIYNSFWCSRSHTHLCKLGKLKIERNQQAACKQYNVYSSTVAYRNESINTAEQCRKLNGADEDDNEANGNNRHLMIPSESHGRDQVKSADTIWSSICRFYGKIRENRREKSKRAALCCCTCRFDFITPMNPFSKKQRFITAIIYAAYTYNILKIFEYLIVGDQFVQHVDETGHKLKENAKSFLNSTMHMHNTANSVTQTLANLSTTIERGILTDLLKQILNVFIIGLRYYPILICVEMRRKRALCYFLCSCYMWCLLVFYLYTNTFCLLSTSALASVDDEATNTSNLTSITSLLDDFKGQLRNITLWPRKSFLTMNTTTANVTVNRTVRRDFISQLTAVTRLTNLTNRLVGINSTNKTVNMSGQSDDDDDQFFVTERQFIFFNNIMYEKLIFYVVLCLITIHLSVETIFLVAKKCTRLARYLRNSDDTKTARLSKILFNDTSTTHAPNEPNKHRSSEYLYTKRIFNATADTKSKSFVKYLFEKYIYKFKMHFKYSKQLINTYVIAFILLYYITCIIIRKSKFILNLTSELLIIFMSFVFKLGTSDNSNLASNSMVLTSRTQLTGHVNALFAHINYDIVLSCCLTTSFYVVQLVLGMRNYQKHTLKAYKGVYTDIPPPKRFTNTKKASSSLHYPGYMIGYLLWGYMILFEVLIVLTVFFRFLIKFYFIIEKFAKYLLPILVIYLFKRIFLFYLTRYFLVKKRNTAKSFTLKNFKLYYFLSHFNFFFDCFLGSFVCIMRMFQSSLASIVFMPRLDYSIYGRSLEHIDMGFISYVNFIHMEVSQTHPIKVAFCEVLLDAIDDARQKKYKSGSGNNNNEDDKRRQIVRNRWRLIRVLLKHQYLYKERKTYIKRHKRVPKVESFEQFLERNMKSMMTNPTNTLKKKTQSSSSLFTTDDESYATLNSTKNETLRRFMFTRKFIKHDV